MRLNATMVFVARTHCVLKNIIFHFNSLSCDFNCLGMLRFQQLTTIECMHVRINVCARACVCLCECLYTALEFAKFQFTLRYNTTQNG